MRKNLLKFLSMMGQQLAQHHFVGHGLSWIVALCIDQEDLEERNTQVSMMGKIYREADQVLVWPGRDWRDEMENMKSMFYRSVEMGTRTTAESNDLKSSQHGN